MAGDAIVTWGKPLTGYWTYREDVPKEHEARHGDSIEAVNEIVQKRPLTVPEMEMVVSDFVERMKEKHPEHDVRYVAIEKGSPLKMRVHLVEHYPRPGRHHSGDNSRGGGRNHSGEVCDGSVVDYRQDGEGDKAVFEQPYRLRHRKSRQDCLDGGAPIAGALVVNEIFFEE